MFWLTFIQYAIPVVVVFLLAWKRIMRIRYSVACLLVLFFADEVLMPLIPIYPLAWPPSLPLAISVVETFLVIFITFLAISFVMWRSLIRSWEDSTPRTGKLVDYAPWLKEKPPTTIREIIAFIKD